MKRWLLVLAALLVAGAASANYFLGSIGQLMGPTLPQGGMPPPPETYRITTEADDVITTESGDPIRTETP